VALGPDNVNLCDVGDSLQLNAGNPGATYLWSTGSTEQSITVDAPGTYFVTVTGSCGLGSDIITITSDGCNQPVLIAPNVFTPDNEDNINENYFLTCQNISYLKLIITNRWGNIVFEGESSDLLNNNPSWDGTNATEGVYFYRYEARDNNEQPLEGHGFLHLIR